MTHWAIKHIGTPYSQLNCAQLVAHVMQVDFGRGDIAASLLGYKQHDGCTRARARAIEHHATDLAAPCDVMLDGHPAVLIVGGRLQHLGLFVVQGAKVSVLHTTQAMGAVCEPLERVQKSYCVQPWKWL